MEDDERVKELLGVLLMSALQHPHHGVDTLLAHIQFTPV